MSGQRDGAKQLILTIELVPQPCFYNNLRNRMPRPAWDKLRKQVYAQYHYRCGICQEENVTLNCHEIWHYDDTAHVQKLSGFIALCNMCHHCKHIGYAGILAAEGKLDMNEVIAHFVHVNSCSYQEYKEHEGQAWKTWAERNKYVWTTDLGVYAHVVR